jgi:hypothetical protein
MQRHNKVNEMLWSPIAINNMVIKTGRMAGESNMMGHIVNKLATHWDTAYNERTCSMQDV